MKRESNIELFRIIVMLSIVAHHYVVNSGITAIISQPPYTWQTHFLYVFGMWGKVGINCFVLITGYFMCKSNITIRKFFKLLLEVWFYNVIIYLIFVVSGYETISIIGAYKALLPIIGINDGFTTCFLVYYLLIPFLNVLVQNITKKQHILLIAICIIFFVILDYLPKYEYRFNYVEWFCILHFIASYIRFYWDDVIFSPKYRWWYILGGTMIALISVITQVRLGDLNNPIGRIGGPYYWVIDCNALLAVASSILLFVGFKNLNIPYNKWINTIATSMFGVLLIHANSDTMRQWLWKDMCHNTDWIYSPYMPLHAFGCVLVIFIACVVIDQVRIHIIEKPAFLLIDKWLNKYNCTLPY